MRHPCHDWGFKAESMVKPYVDSPNTHHDMKVAKQANFSGYFYLDVFEKSR